MQRTSMNDSILSHDTKLRRIRLDNLELYCPHSSTNEESVTFANGAVGYVESYFF
jgi:hypothetical protein